jgi:plastocyanin
MHKSKLVLSILSVLVILAGCGGGDDSSGLPPAPSGGAAGGGASYDPASATGTISGNIMFEGEVPAAARIQMAADPFCQSHSEGATSQEVLVTEDSKLQNVILYVRSGHEDATYPVPSEPVVIDQENCVYSPHVFTMMASQELSITNSDTTLHNIHAWAEVNTPFNIGQPVQGMETKKTFDQPEMPLPIRCDVHRWMNSFVGVFDHPFHTTSGDTGNYELKLPPGTYEIVAWHEKYGEQVSTVEVADNATAELNFSFTEGETTTSE